MQELIEVTGLTKRYGANTVVDHMTFTISDNQVFGFLGPNGAGKSTTMNMLTGCLAISEGRVLIDGHDISREAAEAKRQIGYLPEIPPLYLDMTPQEYLRFAGRARGISKDLLPGAIEIAMKKTHIVEMRNRLNKNLSKGYRQRVGLAQAILGDPKIIILDEPTVGLDPKQIIEIRELIRELGKSHIVLFSSHILTEVAELCEQVMIISKGKLVKISPVEALTKDQLSLEEAFLEITEEKSEA